MNNKFKICTVVQGKNFETFLKNLEKAQKTASMVELRADSISDFGSDDLLLLKSITKLPSIFTFRHKNEGGLFKGSPIKQNDILAKAFNMRFTYIDVAYNNPLVNELTSREKKQLILSYHNHEETPGIDQLWEILDDMLEARPAIIKIATFVNTADDITNLGAVLIAGRRYNKITVIGMGAKGGRTRLIFPKMGSYISYVSMTGDTNISPGMITTEELFSQS